MKSHTIRRGLATTIAAVSVLLAAGCQFGETPQSAAKKKIEGDLARQVGLGKITATCESSKDEPGATFTCESPSNFGRVTWQATVTDHDTIDIVSTNLVTVTSLPALESAAVKVLEEQLGTSVGVDNFDCGSQPVVLDADHRMTCDLHEPTDPTVVYDARLTITDLNHGDFKLDVADHPR